MGLFKRKPKLEPVGELDLQHAFDDCVYFAKQIVGFPLHDFQSEILADPHPTTCFVAGRGAGKTYLAMLHALWTCIREPGAIVVYVAGRQGMSDFAQTVLKNLVDQSRIPLGASIKLEGNERVLFTNGSRVHFLPNSERAVRGFHAQWQSDGQPSPMILLVIDEAAFVDEPTYTSAFSVLNVGEHSKFFCTGSPLSRESWFYNVYVSGLTGEDPSVQSFHRSAEDVAHVESSRNKEFQRAVDDIVYNCEIKAEFAEHGGNYFTPEMIERCVTEYPYPVQQEVAGEVVVSLDLSRSEARSSDFTVLTVLARTMEGRRPLPRAMQRRIDQGIMDDPREDAEGFYRVLDIWRVQFSDTAGIIRQLQHWKGVYGWKLRRAIAESYESMQLDYVFRTVVTQGPESERKTKRGHGAVDMECHVINPTNPLQRTAFGGMHAVMREGMLQIPAANMPAAKALRHELQWFSYQVTDAGNIRYEGAKGKKDDCVYSLLWAIYLLRDAAHLSDRGKAYSLKPLWRPR